MSGSIRRGPGEPRQLDAEHFMCITARRGGRYHYAVWRGDVHPQSGSIRPKKLFSTTCQVSTAEEAMTHAREELRVLVAREHAGAAQRVATGWDTSPGRKWVVVAFWGAETTVTFHRDEPEADTAYEDAINKGADAFYALTKRMMMQRDR